MRSRSLSILVAVLAWTAPQVLAQAPPRPQPTCIKNVALGRGENAPLQTLLLRDGRIEAILAADAEPPPGMHIIDGEGLVCLPAFIDAHTRTGCETPAPVKDQDVPVSTSSDVRVDMRLANRKGIQPSFRASEALAIETKDSEAWREAGFGAAHVVPGGQLLAGTSVLAATREAAMRDIVMKPDVFAHAAFQASAGGGEEGQRRGGGYPSTLMGFIAQLRQFFLDAERHAELERRHSQGRPGMRPPFDNELEAGKALLSGEHVLVCEADSHRDIERWIKLADQFGFKIAISGGRDAWRVADQLAARDIPVLMTLDWGKEVEDPLEKDKKKKGKGKGKEDPESEEEIEEVEDPETPRPGRRTYPDAEHEEEEPAEAEHQEPGGEEEETAGEAGEEETHDAEDGIVWKYEEPLGVRLEKRRKWEEKRDSAIRLHEAGVRFAFGTDAEKPKKFLGKVRDLVEAGLPEDVALAALTTTAAEILGMEKRLGQVVAGYDACLTLWHGDPLTDKKAQPIWIFVDGFPTEYDEPEEKEETAAGGGEGPAEGVVVTGTWTVEVESEQGARESTLELTMAEDGSITGTLTTENPMDQSELTADVTGSVSGNEVILDYTLSVGDFEITVSMTGTIEGDEMSGDATYEMPFSPEPMERSFEGKREPERS